VACSTRRRSGSQAWRNDDTPMRLLAISDIHGSVGAVGRLRVREGNGFDAIVVAGDIGGDAAPEIMDILVSFACPVLYIYGNWDRRLPYDLDFGPTCHHLHLRPVECCGWSFVGISGLPTSWGLNPIAATLRQEVNRRHRSASRDNAEFLGAVRKAEREALLLNRAALAVVIKESNADPTRTVLVAHDRLFGIDRDFPSLSLHLFGHRHGFKMTSHRGTAFVNVSALDDPINGDSYTIIEIDGDRIAANPVRVQVR
jgi:predicted phosphodiesterase